MKTVTVVDYGIGNLLSVRRAFEYCGAKVVFSSEPKVIMRAERLVLPGVGAFADAMQGLRDRNLVGALQLYAQTNQPFLGICLGMQMMMSESEEFGRHEGLDFIQGKVVQIAAKDINGLQQKVPHIGWNQLEYPVENALNCWRDSILSGLKEKSSVYFVHSFTAVPNDPGNRCADAEYGGHLVSAVIRKGNLYGCQFHPEKSGQVGLEIIKNFLQI